MIKLQLPREPLFGQGRFLYCVFIEDPDGGGDDVMFKFRSDIFYTGGEVNWDKIEPFVIKLAKDCFDWLAQYDDEDFTVFVELIGEIFE